MKVKFLLVPILVAAVFMCFSCDGSGSSSTDGEEILRILSGAADESANGITGLPGKQAVSRVGGGIISFPIVDTDPSDGLTFTGSYDFYEESGDIAYEIDLTFTGYAQDGVVINGSMTIDGFFDSPAQTVTVEMTSNLTGTFNSKPFTFSCDVTSTGNGSSMTMTGQYTFNGETESVNMSL